jgi:hypothetical protein
MEGFRLSSLHCVQDRSEFFACHSEYIRFAQYKLHEESPLLVQSLS